MRQEWKEMAVLYFLEQRTIPEICEMLEIPGTVAAPVYRTRMCLKKILGPNTIFNNLKLMLSLKPEIRSYPRLYPRHYAVHFVPCG